MPDYHSCGPAAAFPVVPILPLLQSRLCKNSENPDPREKISHWHGKYRPKTA